MIKSPWSEELIVLLKKHQETTRFHPYTCGKNSKHRVLEPTTTGWICLDCDYHQDWCYEFHKLDKDKPISSDIRSLYE